MPRGSFKDVDRGFRDIVAQMARAAGSPGAHVVVGWPGNAGSQTHLDSDLSVGEIAAIQEFGSGRIPARSMIGATVDENRGKYEQASRDIATGIARGRIDLRKGLDVLGVMIKGDIQARISAGIAPPNAPSTIARKGSSTPLIATGQMRTAIDHEVRDV